MSWFNRTAALRRHAFPLLLLLALAGCGFHPLYGESGQLGDNPALAQITVKPIPNRVGQIIEMALREKFNPDDAPVKPLYILTVTLDVSRSDLGIQRNATSLRSRVTITAAYVLARNSNDRVIYRDESTAVTSFNLPNDAYAATVAEESARETAARQVSDDIATQIDLFLQQHPAG